MADLVVLPDVERLVVDFLLDQSEVTDIAGAGHVFTTLPKEKPEYFARVLQFNDQRRQNALHLVRVSLQVEFYGGAKRTAKRGAETCRALMETRLPGDYGDAVVTAVRTFGMRYEPDEVFTPARPRWLFAAEVTGHPVAVVES